MLTVTGGEAPYTYNWEHDPTLDNSTATDLPTGIYQVTIIDNTGCEKDTFVDLQQGLFLTIEAQLNENLDCGDPTVEAELEVTFDGMDESDLSFNWFTENEADLGSTPILRTDSAGTYIIEVATFFRTCVLTDTITIEEPSSLTFEIDVQSPSSCDPANAVPGAIEIFDIQGGSGIHNCLWSFEGIPEPGINQCARTNLIAGLYEIIIEDLGTGCRTMTTVQLQNDDDVEFIVAPTDPTCPGWDDGLIAIQGTPGGPSLVCVWDDPNITTTSCVATNLTSGSYLVNVEDDTGCNKDITIVLLDPEIFTAEVELISNTVCHGSIDAEITARVLTNPANFTDFGYVWSNNDADSDGLENTNSNFGAGMHSVIISDENGCTLELDFEVMQPDSIFLEADSKLGAALCVGECNGEVNLLATGGTLNGGDYTFTWELDGQETASRDDLCAGSYPISITDTEGCIGLDTVTISNPDSIFLTIVNMTNSGCENEGGSLTIGASGGCGDYSYDWPNNLSDTEMATVLPPGLYEVTVTDACGCSATIEEEITGGESIFAEIVTSADRPACAGQRICLGIDTSTITGGNGNYFFNVDNGAFLDKFPIDTCIMLGPGFHPIQVFDSGNCRADLGIFEVPLADTFAVDLGPSELAVDIGDGPVEIEADFITNSNITDIIWMPADAFECIGDPTSELCNRIRYTGTTSNIISVQIIDENGCTATDEVTITLDTPRRVYRPNIFDPTSSIDDRFMILTGRGVERIEEFYIYDRWGNLLFELPEEAKDFPHSKDDGWDGRVNNRNVEQGVYVYLANVRFSDGQTIRYTGEVTLIR